MHKTKDQTTLLLEERTAHADTQEKLIEAVSTIAALRELLREQGEALIEWEQRVEELESQLSHEGPQELYF